MIDGSFKLPYVLRIFQEVNSKTSLLVKKHSVYAICYSWLCMYLEVVVAVGLNTGGKDLGVRTILNVEPCYQGIE